MDMKADVAEPLFPSSFNKSDMTCSKQGPKEQIYRMWSPNSTVSTTIPPTAGTSPNSTPASSPAQSPILNPTSKRGGYSRPRMGSASYLPLNGCTPWDDFNGRQVRKCSLSSVLTVSCTLLVGVLLGGFGAAAAMNWKNKAIDQTPYEAPPIVTTVPKAYSAAEPLDNSCLIPNLVIPFDKSKPSTFDACGFVIRSTDEVWNLRGNTDEAIDKYFHEDYINAGSWGKRAIGRKALREAVLKEMTAFPDIKIHITDCQCQGNDVDGYKCSMPDVLEGTNTGPSVYGPATGRYARWTGMVQSHVKKDPKTGQWQYFAEWGVHDEWALIQQLGLDFSRVPHAATNIEPIHDCTPLLQFKPDPTYIPTDAQAQQAHRQEVLKSLRAR